MKCHYNEKIYRPIPCRELWEQTGNEDAPEKIGKPIIQRTVDSGITVCPYCGEDLIPITKKPTVRWVINEPSEESAKDFIRVSIKNLVTGYPLGTCSYTANELKSFGMVGVYEVIDK